MSYRVTPSSIPVTVENDTLRLGALTISFQRTLRIPDDGRSHPLPPGLGRFPIRRVDDYADRVPASFRERGGVMIPMYQREAMWLSFGGAPHALKIAVGKVCAVSGKRWESGLSGHPQRYVVTGTQPWLDGIATGAGTIRQFVAMPLGMGYTVEAAITGEEEVGGLQLEAFAPKEGVLESRRQSVRYRMPAPQCASMGLAAGGRMVQKVYPDPHGLDVWDQRVSARVFVHIVSSRDWKAITGEAPPPSPISAKTYRQHGYPWFELYDEHLPTLPGSPALGRVPSIAEQDVEHFGHPLNEGDAVSPWPVRMLKRLGLVRDGDW